MKIKYTKEFTKAVMKQSGKMARSIRAVLEEVKAAKSLDEITDLKKMVGYKSIYRIRIGDMRAFFTFHIEVVDDCVIFRYLVNRGEAYSKEVKKNLSRIDG